MKDLKIELKYNPEDFREIYYQDRQGSMFTYKPTQKAIIYFLSSALLSCIIYFVSYQIPNISWLLVLGFVVTLFTGINASILINKYLRWKADTEAFIKAPAQYKTFNIHLTAEAITFAQDLTITVDKWDSIKSAKFFENYLMLFKENEMAYFIPAKSMNPDEFIKLKDFIIYKLNARLE